MKKGLSLFLFLLGALSLFLFLLSMLLIVPTQASDEIRIGVLAKRGAARTHLRWLGHSLFLEPKIGKKVVFVPLSFIQVDHAAEQKRVDFFFVNSSMFIDLQDKYGAEAIATVVNQGPFGRKTTQFGGVIIANAQSPEIQTLEDVRGRPFYAVKETSLGGYQAAFKEFLDHGIDLPREVQELAFRGTHDAVVRVVGARPGSLGTVRTDILERMKREGKLLGGLVKVINQRQEEENFPFLLSTALYPEWPMAKMPWTNPQDADALAKALMEIPSNSLAARTAGIAGWAAPERYDSVRLLRQALRNYTKR